MMTVYQNEFRVGFVVNLLEIILSSTFYFNKTTSEFGYIS